MGGIPPERLRKTTKITRIDDLPQIQKTIRYGIGGATRPKKFKVGERFE